MLKLIKATPWEQPEDFKLLAQNMQTFEVCGYTEQDGFKEITEIPPGFEQRVLPEHYGRFLTLAEIANFALIENGEMRQILDNTEQAIIELSETSESQDAAMLELSEKIERMVIK
jgi:hypothetical protein